MFYQTATAPALSEACLQSVHVSLNSPVVRMDGLPVAPARAAIVAYAEDYGGLALSVGLRSQTDEEPLIFKFRDPIAGLDHLQGALDAAFDFAEGLGFLFDDDMLHPDRPEARQRALQLWNQLMLPGYVGDGPEHTGTPGLAPSPDDAELLLDDLADLAGETASDLLAGSPTIEPVASANPAASGPSAREAAISTVPTPSLAKFRLAGAESAGAPSDPPESAAPPATPPSDVGAPASSGSMLGRVPIVRMRRRSDPTRPGLLARLLASF